MQEMLMPHSLLAHFLPILKAQPPDAAPTAKWCSSNRVGIVGSTRTERRPAMARKLTVLFVLMLVVGCAATSPTLNEQLNDTDPDVRQKAAAALIQLGDPGSEDLLIEALYKYNDANTATYLLNSGNSEVGKRCTHMGGKPSHSDRGNPTTSAVNATTLAARDLPLQMSIN